MPAPPHKVGNILRKMSYSSDMFRAPACLRARGEPEVSRLCPGILSVLIGGLFLAILITKFIQLINYKEISSSIVYTVQKNLNAPSWQNLKFSISPSWQDYSLWSEKFYVDAALMISTLKSSGNFEAKQIQLQKCKAEQWTQFSSIFDSFVMKQNVCIKKPEDVKLNGTNFYLDISYLQIQIKRCSANQTLNPNGTCLTNDTEFNAGMQFLYQNQSNYFTFYLKDATVNSKKRNPIEEYLPLSYKFYYDNLTRMNVYIYLGTYTVQTDTSIWPIIEDIETITGYYISEVRTSIIDKKVEAQLNKTEGYGTITIAMSTNQIKYSRQVGKIDEAISYAGGLFGLILSFFAFFVFSYNKFCYELLVAECSFNYAESGQKVRSKYFSFFKYIQFQAYDWLRATFNKAPNWSNCPMIYETKDESNMYLDVQYLFRKLRLIDLGVESLLNGQTQKMLYLTQSPDLKEVGERRAQLQYYDEIIGGQQAMNIEDLREQGFRTNQIVAKVSTTSFNLLMAEGNGLPLTSPGELKPQQADTTLKLKEEFRENLKIQDEYILDAMVMPQFREIHQQAKAIQLEEEHEDAELCFVKAYLHTSPQVRQIILNKIPLKILYRFNERINKEKQQDKKTNKSQKLQRKQKNEEELELEKQKQKQNIERIFKQMGMGMSKQEENQD